jgi:hypothetical protein
MTKPDEDVPDHQPSRPWLKADDDRRPIFESVPQVATTGVC